MRQHVCGPVTFEDCTTTVRLVLEEKRYWGIWNAADVEDAIAFLQAWQRQLRQREQHGTPDALRV